jgi:hypothetical protein
MKKLITTIALAIIMVSLTNAQINKPKVKVDVNKVQTQQPSSGLLLNSSMKLNTLQDFNKLNIPVAHITKEQLNAKPISTWSISPTKYKYADLQLYGFNGRWDQNYWTLKSYNDRDHDGDIKRVFANVQTGQVDALGGAGFPMFIGFRATAGVEYRLKIKLIDDVYYTFDYDSRDFIYIIKSNRDREEIVAQINVDTNKEINYVFKEERSGYIYLNFSCIPKLNEEYNIYHWKWVCFNEIKIDRIN